MLTVNQLVVGAWQHKPPLKQDGFEIRCVFTLFVFNDLSQKGIQNSQRQGVAGATRCGRGL